MIDAVAFENFAAQKTRDAASARIERLSTVFDRPEASRFEGIGNEWSRQHYEGDFGVMRADRMQTAVSLMFIQTKDGNTGGSNPAAFGGSATDAHLLYEGLSRVVADAVLAGAGSVHRQAFFSVWHPELVALRASFDLPRHPAQIVVSKRGSVDLDALLFNIPGVRVYLIAGDAGIARHEAALRARPWVRLMRSDGEDLSDIFARLRRDEGIGRISAIGGRHTATRLVDAGLVQDLYLTTTSVEGGEPGTPWYAGTHPPSLTKIIGKQWHEHGSGFMFDHSVFGKLSID